MAKKKISKARDTLNRRFFFVGEREFMEKKGLSICPCCLRYMVWPTKEPDTYDVDNPVLCELCSCSCFRCTSCKGVVHVGEVCFPSSKESREVICSRCISDMKLQWEASHCIVFLKEESEIRSLYEEHVKNSLDLSGHFHDLMLSMRSGSPLEFLGACADPVLGRYGSLPLLTPVRIVESLLRKGKDEDYSRALDLMENIMTIFPVKCAEEYRRIRENPFRLSLPWTIYVTGTILRPFVPGSSVDWEGIFAGLLLEDLILMRDEFPEEVVEPMEIFRRFCLWSRFLLGMVGAYGHTNEIMMVSGKWSPVLYSWVPPLADARLVGQIGGQFISLFRI